MDLGALRDRVAGAYGSGRRRLMGIAFTVSVALLLAIAVQSYAVKPYAIPSGSMAPTLQVGQRVIVDRFSERLGSQPAIGDVLVFTPPLNAVPEEQEGGARLPECATPPVEREPGQPCSREGGQPAEQAYIKRVVAGPGDRLKILGGIPIVNGQPVKGDWETVPCRGALACRFPAEITIPPEHYFMMGDNRPDSEDSRFWGPIPAEWIIGRAVATYWPLNRIGGL